MEIKVLLERNDKLEELVLKLKETLDRANEMFPDFLEQLERESNLTAVSHLEKKNEEEKLKEEINVLKKNIEIFEEENNKLKNEKITIKNNFNLKIETIVKEIENKQNKKEEIYNIKIKEVNNELNKKIDGTQLETE